jgi:uncharacterized protein
LSNSAAIFCSEVAFAELQAVLLRSKFERYLDPSRRDRFLGRRREASALIEIARTIRACRDINDDKFLEVAVNGKADVRVRGDADLLVLVLTKASPLSRRQPI